MISSKYPLDFPESVQNNTMSSEKDSRNADMLQLAKDALTAEAARAVKAGVHGSIVVRLPVIGWKHGLKLPESELGQPYSGCEDLVKLP